MKLLKITLNWIRRTPKTVYVVCPSCHQQGVRQTVPVQSSTQAVSPSAFVPPSQVVIEVAGRAADAMTELDAFRRHKATGDPLRDQMLGDIQSGFTRNVADVGRRLRQSGEQENR